MLPVCKERIDNVSIFYVNKRPETKNAQSTYPLCAFPYKLNRLFRESVPNAAPYKTNFIAGYTVCVRGAFAYGE